MRSSILMLTGLLSAIGCSGRPATTFPEETNAHTFTAVTNGGEEQALASSQGKVLLFVNTASRCGLTRQYTGLQNLQERFGDQGFSGLGGRSIARFAYDKELRSFHGTAALPLLAMQRQV